MPDSFSAEVASRVLADGGNAVDAAVAAGFSLAVTMPEAGNIGGGGFLLAWVGGQAEFLDYRETAPVAAARDMYLDRQGQVLAGQSLVGHRAVGVPGTVAGLWAAHQRHGRLPWQRLVEPAIALARDGFVVPPQLARFVAEELPGFDGRTRFADHFGRLRAGERFHQPQLAAVLERIAIRGPEDFYRGETAALLLAEMQRGGGLIGAADLAGYRPVWRESLRRRWRDAEVLTAPLPSSGGIALLQMLALKDALAADFAGHARNSAQYVHLSAEIAKRVFADRAEYLGDPDFVSVPVAALLDPDYLARRAQEVDRAHISSLGSVRPGLEPVHTTHFSIVDHEGNAVANTYTLNTSFGSGVVVEGAGFLLNSEMDDFSLKPGVPNYFGVVGARANEIEPGKRMLSSMAPTILLRNGRVATVLGSSGGSTIITTVWQALINIEDFGLDAEAAVGAPRFHHQLLPPDLVTYTPSRPLPAATIEELGRNGYRVEPHSYEYGDLQLILRNAGGLQAASDPRGRGESRVLP
ncbi:MAG: gamma-glutamyltransferase [Gammaproteobacteria bacterium]|nr:MAG: gamma-glutamyltransferase [Gammaproteobacteria bacterium]